MIKDPKDVYKVACCRPVKTAGLPYPDKIPPALIDDTLDVCASCGCGIWVGPAKRFLASLGELELWCYLCALETANAEIVLGLTDQMQMMSINPLREEIPRLPR